MIIATRRGNILCNCERRIAFPINIEGVMSSDFESLISRRYWPELAKVGKNALGTIFSKKVEGIEFFALCCYSLHNGWFDQEGTITKCFDAIPGDERVASTAIGTSFFDIHSGANVDLIQAGMQASNKKIILYYTS